MSDGGDGGPYDIGSYTDPRFDGPIDTRREHDTSLRGLRRSSPRRPRKLGLRRRLVGFAVGTFAVGSFAYQTDPAALFFVVPLALLVLWLLVKRGGK